MERDALQVDVNTTKRDMEIANAELADRSALLQRLVAQLAHTQGDSVALKEKLQATGIQLSNTTKELLDKV